MKIEHLTISDVYVRRQIRELYSGGEAQPEDQFEYVSCELFDEWRWGVIRLLVLRDREGKLWGTMVREQTGDHYYCNLDEDSEITFETVIAVPKTEYVLARLNKW